MGFSAKASTSLHELAKLLSGNIKENKADILRPDFIITPNNGLKNWLKVQIAEHNGIAVNLQFLPITQMLSIVYKILGGKGISRDTLSMEQSQWLLFGIMGEGEFLEKFPERAAYFQGNAPKRFALAVKVAALINKYELFIPNTVATWENNQSDDITEMAGWQRFLWKKLKEKAGSGFATPIDSYLFIKEKLEDVTCQQELKTKLPAISVFNLNDFNTASLEILLALSAHIEVNMYFFSPIQAAVQGNLHNTLLRNWIGNQKTVLDYLTANGIEIKFLSSVENAKGNSLLKKMQQDIIFNQQHLELSMEDLQDGSLVVNGCYTPNREVEVLYNYLVKTIVVGEKKSIGARDIAVICTDISKYAAAIKAVFDTAPYKFPYHIVDYPEQDTDSPLMALDAILSIDTRWFKPEQVMHLLEYPAICDKYNITDVPLLRHLVDASNIRSGYSGQIEENETHLISWEHGLNRLLLGFCMAGEEKYEYGNDGYLLVDKTEGSSGYELIKFRCFISNLNEQLKAIHEIKTLDEWVDFVRETIELFILGNNDNRLSLLDKSLADLTVLTDSVPEKISFLTFYMSLKASLMDISSDENITRKGITFCSSMPSRSVPFKVIALLGLNYDSFPRKSASLSFDILQNEPESKLNSPKEKDKFFFLETLLSAQDHLFLSYISKDVNDNKERPPSSLLDELLDYIQSRITPKPSMVLEHPLHHFDSRYFDPTQPLYYSYLGTSVLADTSDFFGENGKEPGSDISEITVFKFLQYFKDGFKHYYNNALGIYYKDEDELLADEELFEMDNLQQWGLKNNFAKAIDELDNRLELVEKGQLPLACLGEVFLEDAKEKVSGVNILFKQATNDLSETSLDINLLVNGTVRVKGKIDSVYEGRFIYNNVSSKESENKNKIAAYISFLLLNVSGHKIDLYYNSISDGLNIIKSDAIPIQELNATYAAIAPLVSKGLTSIVPFYPDFLKSLKEISGKMLKDQEEYIDKMLTKNKFLSEYVKKEWENKYFSDPNNINALIANLELIQDNILSKFVSSINKCNTRFSSNLDGYPSRLDETENRNSCCNDKKLFSAHRWSKVPN